MRFKNSDSKRMFHLYLRYEKQMLKNIKSLKTNVYDQKQKKIKTATKKQTNKYMKE